jgi:hypothetical protein
MLLTNKNQPMADLESDTNNTPLIKSGKQQANQLAQGPSENQPYGGGGGGGVKSPTRLAREGVRRSYDDVRKTKLDGVSPLLRRETSMGTKTVNEHLPQVLHARPTCSHLCISLGKVNKDNT